MSEINLIFRKEWNNKFPDIPIWRGSTEKEEHRPIKELYENADTDLKLKEWVKFMGYQDFKLDICFQDYQLAVEIDGGNHGRAEVAAKDRRKANLLQILGWSVLRYDALTIINSKELVYEQILECLLGNFDVPERIRTKYIDY